MHSQSKVRRTSSEIEVAFPDVGEINALEYSKKWTINCFSFYANHPYSIISPIFSMNYKGARYLASMILEIRKMTGTGEKYLSVYLRNQNGFQIIAQLEVSLLNNRNIKVLRKETNRFTLERGCRTGFTNFANLKSVMDAQYGIVDNDQLNILCLLKFGEPPKIIDENQDIQIGNEIKKDDHSVSLKTLNDFGKMFGHGIFSDVTISTADGKNFHLHKCVLASRSSVFQAMLNNDMRESNQNLIVIEDISYEIMKELFRFMYTGKVEQIETVAEGLLKAAHKYFIEDLMVMCEKTLCKKLTLDNVLKYLILSDLYSAKNLKTEAIRYFVLHGKNIVEKPEFKASVNVETACEIITAIFANNKK